MTQIWTAKMNVKTKHRRFAAFFYFYALITYLMSSYKPTKFKAVRNEFKILYKILLVTNCLVYDSL